MLGLCGVDLGGGHCAHYTLIVECPSEETRPYREIKAASKVRRNLISIFFLHLLK